MDRTNNQVRHDLVAKRLKELREKTGLSQRALALKLGREQAVICRIENGDQRINLLDFFDWCDALGVRASEIISGTEEKT